MQRFIASSQLLAGVALAQSSHNGLSSFSKQLLDASELNTNDPINEGIKHQYELFGDCLGFSPIVFGTQGGYIQSDMQYAQQTVELMRQFGVDYEYAEKLQGAPEMEGKLMTGRIKTEVAMSLQANFFVSRKQEAGVKVPSSRMEASRLRVVEDDSFSFDVDEELYEEEELLGMMDIDIEKGIYLNAAVHGSERDDLHYGKYENISLEGRVIESVLFDKDGAWAGLRIVDPVTKEYTIHSAIDAGQLRAARNDKTLMRMNESTRIVGFRTTKRCADDKQITSLQPIYFSVDENVCRNILVVPTHGMMQEIESYGPLCSEVAENTYLTNLNVNDAPESGGKKATNQMQKVTSFVLVITFGCLLYLAFFEAREFCTDRMVRKSQKLRALNEPGSERNSIPARSSQPVMTEAPMFSAQDRDQRKIEDAVDESPAADADVVTLPV